MVKDFNAILSLAMKELMGKIDHGASCHGKFKHPSAEKAERSAAHMAEKKKEPFEAYKCRHCDGWHVGHPKFWKAKPFNTEFAQAFLESGVVEAALATEVRNLNVELMQLKNQVSVLSRGRSQCLMCSLSDWWRRVRRRWVKKR